MRSRVIWENTRRGEKFDVGFDDDLYGKTDISIMQIYKFMLELKDHSFNSISFSICLKDILTFFEFWIFSLYPLFIFVILSQ